MEVNPKNLPNYFNPDLIMKGQQGELIVSHILRKEGYYVTCLSDINEQQKPGAPGMRNNREYRILPDLQAALKGKLGYCEVKWKTQASWTRKTQREEHGVDKRNWDHYSEIKEITGVDVFLFIYERKTGAVLYNHIDYLEKLLRYTPKMGRGGMCFFPRASFHLWGKVALLGQDYYHQLDMFTMMNLEGKGDKLFGIIRHKKQMQL